MAAIRFFLLLILLGGLTVLLVQNWTPVLSLVFLGGQTQALPLSIWILFSVAAGAITSIFIASCFQIASYFAQPRAKKQRRRAAKTSTRFASEEKNPNKTPDPPKTNTYSYTASSPRPTQPSVQESDGWDTTANDDWNFTEDTEPATQDPPDRQEYTDRVVADRKRSSNLDDDWDYVPQDTQRQPQERQKNYASDETNRPTSNDTNEPNEPNSSDRSASVYSYSAREPKNSGIGRTESVYDAEYRVLTPPYKQQNTSSPPPSNRPQNNDDDDWGFVDDEDWKVDNEDDSSRSEK
ncbi:MAG: hypothetical protein CLLPBCKN_005846 [Chroococcidiopsis cubana SAG 39.79]|uniref:Lipopolysaccharide assembly protein A domain-containing protein n=1 Tax=Chroococcidiopsis cubana SAG 39.79 TaxID=388085 RepID=A0AB37UMP6_9CYAN|nr:LapA family protein [Chroococcidiopsis cubana]MDZ4876426.1 hypothetical protein [Chroococcidiopsis cubana SAG 39.79]PSB61209.1 hypothetical protein C7B79_22855 [Chroococcidiopsis cubana CCALA 043]RUT12700.1 hypothetical protein DSM107010_20810 [Chroococcidiopsis cubana SAG 39.79]